jgi:hypothetical protein
LSTTPDQTAVAIVAPSKLDTILEDAALALETVGGLGAVINPGIAAGAALANKVLRLITAGVQAHEKITGQPLDLSLLHPIDLIP